MTRPSPTRARLSKNRTDQTIGRDRSNDRWFAPVISALSREFPKKLAHVLADHAHRPVRVCELWLQGRQSPNGEALAALIRSPIGDKVLAALTSDCEFDWIARDRKVRRIARIRQLQAEQARELRELEEGF